MKKGIIKQASPGQLELDHLVNIVIEKQKMNQKDYIFCPFCGEEKAHTSRHYLEETQ